MTAADEDQKHCNCAWAATASEKVNITVTLYSLIWEVLVSNLGEGTKYSERFLAFLIPPKKSYTVPLLRLDPLPSTSLPVHHSSSSFLTLCILDADDVIK
jgi:hypothetical protein